MQYCFIDDLICFWVFCLKMTSEYNFVFHIYLSGTLQLLVGTVLYYDRILVENIGGGELKMEEGGVENGGRGG